MDLRIWRVSVIFADMIWKNRKIENIIYAAAWLLTFGVCLLVEMKMRSQAGMTVVSVESLLRVVAGLLPFMILFVVNNYLLIAKLLMRGLTRWYFLYVALALTALWVYQYFDFMGHLPPAHGHIPPPDAGHPRPSIPLPLMLDFTYGILVVGVNLAIALMVQHFDDKLERESLMKANAQNELAYLRSQINPHFYMNMLNNIHGMIEIDAARAQKMVIDMSTMMRYMLYESSQPEVPLLREVEFMRSYIALMRQRFPEKRVSITVNFPSDVEMADIMVPPLLFLIFVENAFKHGISYKEKSFIAVSLELIDNSLHFSCMNSLNQEKDDDKPGIGLQNVRQRLRLLYGDRVELETLLHSSSFLVNLTLPIHETQYRNN